MGETICFASSKGGSGKTTLAATIGTFLAEVGFKVLLVDCDEGTHGLTLMYLDEVNRYRKSTNKSVQGVFEYGRSKIVSEDGFSAIPISEKLSLVPARFVFSDFDGLSVQDNFIEVLNDLVGSFRSEFDFILLDAQAGISDASRAAMSPKNSDTVILVSEYDPMSNAGIERLKARLPDELDVGRTWILLNKLLPEFVAKFSEFLSVSRYLPPIPWTADVVRAYSRRRLALDFQEGNQYTLGVLAVVRELLDVEQSPVLEDWLERQAARLREPLGEQLHDAEKLLEAAREERKRLLSDPSVLSELLGTQLSVIAGAVTAAAALLAAFDLAQLESLLREITSSYLGQAVVLSVATIATVSTLGAMLRINISSRRDQRREMYEEATFRMRELEARVKELSELYSSHYEDIVSRGGIEQNPRRQRVR